MFRSSIHLYLTSTVAVVDDATVEASDVVLPSTNLADLGLNEALYGDEDEMVDVELTEEDMNDPALLAELSGMGGEGKSRSAIQTNTVTSIAAQYSDINNNSI